ncbi:M1 family aminopeptidase [Sphingobacterium sp. WM]|uniref:ABC transporter permease/M1 family aminopeptidase n=1 Tax=Sphingobacterium sp. WM TaxID=3031802 RepID=UPI00240D714B|nr:M1 family aminopeptidase [Sphingobacterium sp. WM]WFB65059.1 M1 family aminopeptidase [Sphingobacterium sp. WM]
MFKTIFLFEIKRWLKQPVFYVYCAIYFGLAYFTTISSLGAFDAISSTTSTPVNINSPLHIAGFLNSFSTLIYFLLPTIIGASVYRDYLYNMHTLLFSYPLNKLNYLSAKFLSSLVIVTIIALLCVLAFYLGQFQPNINKDLLGPNNFRAYVEGFLVTVIPNFILFGIIIFALVTFSRNIYVGFVFVLILFLLQSLLDAAMQNMDNRYLAAILDPFGFEPIQYYSRYWSVDEQNTNLLPIRGVLIYNRLIWLGFAALLFGFVYYKFSFSQLGISFKKAKSSDRMVKDNFGSILKIALPQVKKDYSFWSNLKLSWRLSNNDFKFLVKNWTFIILLIIAFLFVLVVISVSGEIFGTSTYPVTWQVLISMGSIYSFFLNIMIFLFSGMLIQRSRQTNMFLLIEATSVPNWVLLFSKVIAMIKMVYLVMLVCLINGIVYQIYEGYYQFEIGHYMYELFVLIPIKVLYLILFAFFIHNFFKNYFIGFIICLVLFFSLPFLSKIGIEQMIFRPHADPSYNYSDMNGYGEIRHFIYYRIYWILLGIVMFGLTLLFWRRGIISNIKEKFNLVAQRAKPQLIVPMVLAIAGFIGLGYGIYSENNVKQPHYSALERELQQVDYEKQYKRYEGRSIPRLVDVKVDMDIDPKNRNFNTLGKFVYVNKTSEPIDTIFMNKSPDNIISAKFDRDAKRIVQDSVLAVDIYFLSKALNPGDTLKIDYTIRNKANGFLFDRSSVLENGTFLNNLIFPVLSYSESGELVDNNVRKKYGLPDKMRMPDPRDSSKLGNNYISQDADWITFEATLSTDKDQIAIAPGYLQKEWEKDGKRYFHYKMDAPILNFYSFMSAKYETKKEKYKGKNLEIYYHKGHEFNLDRMMASMKKSLDYYEHNFGPYQFQQMRIIEFPSSMGTFAQAFANTVPFSEGIGFIAKVDEKDPNAVDYAYSVVAHEFAHQWWAHQVIGAYVQGSTMMSESLAEYSSLKVLEHTYGKEQMFRFLKDALDKYLLGRSNEKIRENPLMFNENQPYIHYNKGSMVMYAMSDYLGEQKFNDFLKNYTSQYKFQNPPYTTSIEFVNMLKPVVPDSLQYLVKDLFETVTIYDNKVTDAKVKDLGNNKYEVEISFQVSKYRTDPLGKKSYEDIKGTALTHKEGKKSIQSLPLEDYVEIGIFAEETEKNGFKFDNPILLKKVKLSEINNKLKFVVDKKPVQVGVDPNYKLLDTDSEDNRKKI